MNSPLDIVDCEWPFDGRIIPRDSFIELPVNPSTGGCDESAPIAFRFSGEPDHLFGLNKWLLVNDEGGLASDIIWWDWYVPGGERVVTLRSPLGVDFELRMVFRDLDGPEWVRFIVGPRARTE